MVQKGLIGKVPEALVNGGSSRVNADLAMIGFEKSA